MNEKQKRFAIEYAKTGNGTQSYKTAFGQHVTYGAAAVEASKLIKNPKVMEYIDKLNQDIIDDSIADMMEVQRFWTETMRSKAHRMADRLDASDKIARSNGAYLERVEQSGQIDLKVEWFNDED